MYRNMESLHYVTGTNSVAGQSYFRNKFIENSEIRFVATRTGEGELNEGSHPAGTFSYKYSRYNVQHNTYICHI